MAVLYLLQGHASTRHADLPGLRRWLDIDKPWVDNPAFIVHFAGCGMCSSGFHPERLGECDVEYIRIFAESFGHLKDAGAPPILAALDISLISGYKREPY